MSFYSRYLAINFVLKMTAVKSIGEKNKTGIQAQFLAEVEFGNPRTKDCRNFGICRVYPMGLDHKITTCKCKFAQAIITILDNDKVELDFLKSTITPTTYKLFFGGNYFLIPTDFRYDFFKDKAYSFHIASGSYPIIENDSLIKVIFE